MTKKLRNIINDIPVVLLFIALAVVWQLVSVLGIVPAFMLPSPGSVVGAFIADFDLLVSHAQITLTEAFCGLFLGILAAFVFSALMDRYVYFYKSFYPILLLTQTVPAVALAPLLILWMGYGVAPKITLVFLTCFFPMTVGLFDGIKSADWDAITLMKAMGAKNYQIFWQLKLPGALPRFFSGLKIAVTYAIVGAVVAEWLGGNGGLGVYMTRVRKSYSFDKMFAVIFLISIISIVLLRLTILLEKKAMPWQDRNSE